MDDFVGVQVRQAAQDLAADVRDPLLLEALPFGGCRVAGVVKRGVAEGAWRKQKIKKTKRITRQSIGRPNRFAPMATGGFGFTNLMID